MTFEKSRRERYAVRDDVVRVVGFEPTRRLAKEPKGDVTLMKGLKPPECFIIALQNTYQQSKFSGING